MIWLWPTLAVLLSIGSVGFSLVALYVEVRKELGVPRADSVFAEPQAYRHLPRSPE